MWNGHGMNSFCVNSEGTVGVLFDWDKPLGSESVALSQNGLSGVKRLSDLGWVLSIMKRVI